MDAKADMIEMEANLASEDHDTLVMYVEAVYDQMTIEEINQEWMDSMVNWDFGRRAQTRYEYGG